MKTIKIFLPFVFFVWIANIFSQSYLPLDRNNKWYFDYGDCDGSPVFGNCNKSLLVSNVTADSVMSNGYQYYKVYGIYLGVTEWIRSDTNWIYGYYNDDSLGYIDLKIFDLHSNIGDNYNYSRYEYQISTLQNRDTINYFNEEIEVLSYKLAAFADADFELVLSHKYGFINYKNIGYGGWSYYNLRGCIINGETFGDVTSVERDEETVPFEYELSQNYPNPFNPTTNISYKLPLSQNVEIKVYDILGNEVATLINEYQIAGEHKISFYGNSFVSGVYIYQIITQDFQKAYKMILLK